jgi:hypothetical protein
MIEEVERVLMANKSLRRVKVGDELSPWKNVAGGVSVEVTREEERDRKLKKVLVQMESKKRDNRNNEANVEATRLKAWGF